MQGAKYKNQILSFWKIDRLISMKKLNFKLKNVSYFLLNVYTKTKIFAKLFCLFIWGPGGLFYLKKFQQSCDTVPLIS